MLNLVVVVFRCSHTRLYEAMNPPQLRSWEVITSHISNCVIGSGSIKTLAIKGFHKNIFWHVERWQCWSSGMELNQWYCKLFHSFWLEAGVVLPGSRLASVKAPELSSWLVLLKVVRYLENPILIALPIVMQRLLRKGRTSCMAKLIAKYSASATGPDKVIVDWSLLDHITIHADYKATLGNGWVKFFFVWPKACEVSLNITVEFALT
jgi:hypothetical protein